MYCDLCGAEIRWPDEPCEFELEDGSEVILCPDCLTLEEMEFEDD